MTCTDLGLAQCLATHGTRSLVPQSPCMSSLPCTLGLWVPNAHHAPQASPRRVPVLGVGDSSSSACSLWGGKERSQIVPRDSESSAGDGLVPGEHGWREVAGEAELCRGRCSSRRRCPLLLPKLLLFASSPGKLCAVGW